MAEPYVFPLPPKLSILDIPNPKYHYLFKDGPRYANFLVSDLLEEKDRFIANGQELEAENARLHKLNTWEASRLPPTMQYMLKEGSQTSTKFVTYLFQVLLQEKEKNKNLIAAQTDADADIKSKAEKIAQMQTEGDKLFEEKQAQDQRVKTMQTRHNTTINNLRNEKKLLSDEKKVLSDENINHVKVNAREQITKKQLQAGNAQKDEQIQQLQERIQVLEWQPPVEQNVEELRQELDYLKQENAELASNIIYGDDGYVLTPELYEVNQILAPEGNVIMTQNNVRATQQMVTNLENELDKEKKENQALKEEVTNTRAQLICEPDGTIAKQEDYNALQKSTTGKQQDYKALKKTISGSMTENIKMANEQIKKIQENEALQKEVTKTQAQLITEPDGTIAKQEDYNTFKETNRTFTTQAIQTANEHFKKVQELEANNVYHEGARVTQEQFKDIFSAASQAARHDNRDIVTQQQWIDTRARAYQAAINEDNSMVTQQQWVDTRARASQAVTNEDGTLVTNEQVQKLDSQIIRKSDGSVCTIEEVRELEAEVNTLGAQVKDLDANLIRDDSGAILTRSEIKRQWDEENAHLVSEVTEAKDGKDVAEKKCLAMDNHIIDLKAQAIDSQKKEIALITEAKEAKEGRDVAEKKCLVMDKDIANLKAQATDFQKKETDMVSEVQEAKEGRDVAEKKCLAIDKDIADLKAQAIDFQKKESDMVSEVQEAKEGRDVAEKKCLAIDKDIAELKAEAKDARKKEIDLVSEAREAKKNRTVAEKKCLAIDKDIAKLKTELIEAQKAKDFAEKKSSEMEEDAATPSPKRYNGTIVDQQGYEDEAKIRSDAIAYLQWIITDGKAKIAALELSKEEAKGEKTRLTAELESAKDENVDLKKSKLGDKEEITRLTEELSSAKVDISQLEAAPPDLVAENQRLEDAFTRLQDIYQQQGRELERVESSHADLEVEHKEVKDVKQGLLKQIESLQNELKQALEKFGKLEQEHAPCGKAKSDLINLQSKVNKLEKELKGKDKELEKAGKESDEMSELKKKILEAQTAVVAELKQARTQLSESKEDNQILATGKAEVEASLGAVTHESAGLMKAVDGLRDDITSMGMEIEGLEEENGELRSKLQKKADPIDPKASTPEPFPVTDSSAKKPLLGSIAEEDEDDEVAVTGEEPVAPTPVMPTVLDDASFENGEVGAPVLPHATGTAGDDFHGQYTGPGAPEEPIASTPVLPTVLDDASSENGEVGAPVLPHATGTAGDDFHGQYTGPGAPEEPVASTPVLPTVLDDASFKNGEVGAPTLPHGAGTAAGNSNGQETASGAPIAIVPYHNQTERPPATSGLGWKVNGLLWLLLLLLFFGVSMGVSWWRRTELLGRGDDLARLALISLRAGGGTGTAWPAWLYDDDVAEIVGGFYA